MVDAVVKKKKDILEGEATHFHTYSPDRVTPFCGHFGVCGGCKLQHISYEGQLAAKDQIVHDALTRIGKVSVGTFEPIIGAEETRFYRNKLEFAFSNKRWLTYDELKSGISNQEDVLGFHRAGAFDKILNIDTCYLMAEPMNAIRNAMRTIAIEQGLVFFDTKEQKGFLRQTMIRITTLGDILLVVGFYKEHEYRRNNYLNAIAEQFPQITSLQYFINGKGNDSFHGMDIKVHYGKPYIEEKLGDVTFRIGPHSFFQTSTRQAERLFDTVKDFADFKGHENVYDLYTGLGSIALYVAKACKQVVAIEEIEEAIIDARANAELNSIDNCIFYAGDVKNILTAEFAALHGKPDILITDPPRAGMHEKVVEMLLQLAAPKIVYVSCNPATQARDLQLLSVKYDVQRSRAVDMFPYTHHIENVALLTLKPEFV